IWQDILIFLILINFVTVCLSILIVIRNFNTSWIGKMWVTGKAETTTVMHNLIQFIGLGLFLSIFLGYLFLNPDPFEGTNSYNLFLAVFNAIANLLLILTVFKKSYYTKYSGFDFFVQTMVFFYLFCIIPILLINFVEMGAILPISNFGLLIFAILAITQAINMPRPELEEKMKRESILRRSKEGKTKKDLYVNKDDKDIVIINIEEGEEPPIFKPKPKKPEKEKSKKQISKDETLVKDGEMIIFLGLCISIQFLIVHFFINQEILFPIPFLNIPVMNLPFTWEDLDSILSIIGFGTIIIAVIIYFISKKNREWYANKFQTIAAFWEFLTLIERTERIKFLTELAEYVRETLFSGIMDFIDRARDDIEGTIEEGREFFRKLFGIE
ncbi:MAG: hypothetical protein ACTSR3_15350, partial [Candidatus Helarchaeota archaeon]